MTEPQPVAQASGLDVYIITYDEEGNEVRLLPEDVTEDVLDRSRHLGIGKGRHEIHRPKHGPFIAAESELRTVNVGSLGRAIAGDTYGTLLLVDLSEPPINEDVLEIDDRFDLDVDDVGLVAIVTQRYATQPAQTPKEIAASLTRVAAAYYCRIVDVSFALPGGSTPDELLATWPEDEDWAAKFRVEMMESLARSAHDVKVVLATDDGNAVETLITGAAAVADFLKATQDGPLSAEGVLNLLRGGHFDALIGQSESEHLEVKTTMHPIWVSGTAGAKAKVELAQDVARFANGDVDAVLVIGYHECGSGDNQIGSLTPVPDTYLNIMQINEVLDARIVPPVDGLVVENFSTSPMESMLAIYVPKQPSEMQPYLVHGVIVEGKLEGAFFSIVRRRGEGSITTSAQQIHAYIVAGKRYLRVND